MTNREKLIELLLSGDKTVQCEHSREVNCDGMKCAFCERVEIADHLLAHGVTFAKDTDVPSKWISVEDDKPKRRGEYFVSYVFADCNMRFYGAAFWRDDLETNGYVTGPHFSNEGVDGMKVTHWMEIQKLPVGNPSVSLEADSLRPGSQA